MIPYTYTVVEADENGTVLRYESPGREPILRGIVTPTEFESLDHLAQQYAPIADWIKAGARRMVPALGSTGSYSPPTPQEDVRTPLERAKDEKKAVIAAWRFSQETKGIMVAGAKILTDRESQSTINGALVSLREGLISSVDWKAANGQFVQLTLAEITVVAQAVARHVQACFTTEAQLVSLVDAAATVEDVEAVAIPEEVISGVL